MSAARGAILASIRRSLGRGALSAGVAAELRSRLAAHPRNLLPARATALDHRGQIDLFVAMAEEVQATLTRVASLAEVPEAVMRYLAAENLPAELILAPDPRLDNIPWHTRPLLNVRHGQADATDRTSLTGCFAAIAESGTLMLASGAESPTSLNFLPDTHIVVVESGQVVATYEDGWDRLRAAVDGKGPSAGLPRVVNFITGSSRTADIEQRIVLGAHGPRRLQIVLVESRTDAKFGENED